MTSAFLGKTGKKLFEKHIEQYAPADPLYEVYVDERGVQRRRKRDTPPGLSKRDIAILKAVRSRAHYLDKGFRICGLRFGWTFFIGLIPIVGDITDVLLNYNLVVKKAKKADLPDWLIHRMLLNNAISAGVGFVPLVGDVILAMYKANSRNAALLEEFLRIRGEEFIKAGGVIEEAPKKSFWGRGSGPGNKSAKQATPAAIPDANLRAEAAAAGPSTSIAAETPQKKKSSGLSLFGSKKEVAAPTTNTA
ncbi:hypothetical protein CVT24_006671 [Panaeolus cyanescens]|uniref:PH domain-containing protein n=1 Tax=Panaeolus cyanescens TaxID=181874 RepID=A0A409WBZ0_9AGAR|nr:hypothetical protein CVT24_006671 [Panaeolus cyanescens]